MNSAIFYIFIFYIHACSSSKITYEFRPLPPPSTLTINTIRSHSSSPPCVAEDCRGLIRVLCNGTIERGPDPVFPIPILNDNTVESKEVQFGPDNLNLRLYKPLNENSKRPIIFYFHGGGFCFGHCSWPQVHNLCVRIASQLKAVVVVPDYRLAPENRLPAAFDDSVLSVRWLRDNAAADPWLADVADLGDVTILGDSSGGTIAHSLAVRFGSAVGRSELAPVAIKGYVLLGPFFGGIERTRSEEDCPKDASLNLEICDQFWRLSLPVGTDRDHPFSNPFGPESVGLEAVEFGPVLVVVGGRDLLRDRGVEYAERLKAMQKPVQLVEFEGEEHGFVTDKPESAAAVEFMAALERFVAENADGSAE